MPLCSFGDQRIRLDITNDSWIFDGEYFYAKIGGKGLVKISTGSDGRTPGRIIAVNAEFDKNLASMMQLEDKIYIRHSEIKPAPFTVIDKNTLQEVKIDPEIKFETNQTQTIQWKSEDDFGRSLEYTPLITDGTFVYVIAKYRTPKNQDEEPDEDEDKSPKLVVEVYDPSKGFQFVKMVTLMRRKSEAPFVKSNNSVEWLQ
jgi:hypothetical protein